MNQRRDEIIWDAHWPAASSCEDTFSELLIPRWLSEVWSLRGYVLYNESERPQFKISEDDYSDPDYADLASYHLLAYSNMQLVGCVRLLPLTTGCRGITESCLGEGAFGQMLQDLGTGRAEAIEGGRWLAHPGHRRHKLGVLLAAAGVSLARHLGYRILFCSVGTKNKQHRVLARLGFKPVPTVKPFFNEAFADVLQAMYIVPCRPTLHFGAMMDIIAEKLRLIPSALNTDVCEPNHGGRST